MVYYTIRHKASLKTMNLRVSNKGYSHWLAEDEGQEFDLQVPRLFLSEKKAKRSIVEWVKGPVKWVEKEYLPNDVILLEGLHNMWMPEMVRKPVNNGRKKEDVEVVAIKLEEL